MRIDATSLHDPGLWRVYDYKLGAVRFDVRWADDVLNQIGVLVDRTHFVDCEVRTEQRGLVLIIAALRWIALDPPIADEPALFESDVAARFVWRRTTSNSST